MIKLILFIISMQYTAKRPFIQNVCNQGGWVSSADIFRTKEFFRCGRPHFFVQKTSEFSKFIVYPHGKGGSEPVRTRGERRSFFSRFMDGPQSKIAITYLKNTLRQHGVFIARSNYD